MRKAAIVVLWISIVVGAGNVVAAPCAGFSDVDDSSIFCSGVTWIKNRSVTLGCGDGTTYCPNDAVGRLQMAAFMQRLGTALIPSVAFNNQTYFNVSLATGAYLCPTPTVPAQNYPRFATIAITADYGLTAFGNLIADPVYSLNGGASWTLANPVNHLWAADSAGVGNSSAISVPIAVPAGMSLTAALFVSRSALSSADLVAITCLVRGTVQSSFAP